MMQPATYSHTAENSQWGAYYLRTISRQLEHVIALAIRTKGRPDFLAQHFDSMLAVFEQGILYPDRDRPTQLIQFVRALHPLPVWWGKWTEWNWVLGKTIAAMQEKGEKEQLSWLTLIQAEMLLSSGNAKQALELATKVLRLAAQNLPELQLRAEMVAFEANKSLGSITDRLAGIARLEKMLKEKKHLLPELKHQRLTAQFLIKKANEQRRQGFPGKAMKSVNRALFLAKKHAGNDKLLMAEIYSQRSYAFWSLEKLEQTVKNLKLATALYKEIGNHTAQIDCMGDLGLTYWSALKYDKAERTLQESIHMAEEAKTLWWQAIQTGNLGLVNFTRGKLSNALALMEQHHTLSQLTNNKPEIERANGNIGLVQIFRGKFQEAHDRLMTNLAYTDKMELYVGKGTVLVNLAWALEGLGQVNKGMEYAQEALAISEKVVSPQLQIIALRSLSELQNDPKEKTRYAEEALTLARERSRRLNEAGALLTLSECYRDESYRQGAESILKKLGSQEWLQIPPVFKTLRLPLLLWG